MRWLLFIALLWAAGVAATPQQTLVFRDEAQEQQYRQITAALRCPKCQNNSIADSGSMIAVDLRLKVYQLLQEGKTRPQIVDYMVARYGNFVTYDPPLTPVTSLLWGVPGAALLFGAWLIVARSRRRVREEQPKAVAQPQSASQGSRWLFLPGGALALLVAGGVWLATNGVAQVTAWQQATRQTPALLAQALDRRAAPLNPPQLQQLALGLRTRLYEAPENVSGWLTLGHIGMMQGNARMAADAFTRALQLIPENDPRRDEIARRLAKATDQRASLSAKL